VMMGKLTADTSRPLQHAGGGNTLLDISGRG
jgi:hypothetical protein